MAKLSQYKDLKYGSFPNDRIDPKKKLDKQWYIANLQSLLHYYVTDKCDIPFTWGADRYSFKTLREYATGKQGNVSVKRKLLKEIGTSGTFKTKLKDVFQTYDIMPEFFDVIRAINQKQEYDITCNAIDDSSLSDKDVERGMIKFLVQKETKDLLNRFQYKPQAQLSMEDLAFMTEADVDILFDAGGVQLQREIAASAACDYSRMISGDKEVENLCNDDLITLGLAAVRDYIDYSTMEVKYAYVDPNSLILPHSKYNDYRDITRIGQIDYLTIAEIKELNPNLTKDQLRDILEENAHLNEKYFAYQNGQEGYYGDYGVDPMDQCRVCVIRGQWLSANYENHLEAKAADGSLIYKPVKFDYKLNSQETKKGAKIDNKRIISKYHAVWIMGTEHLLQYGEVTDKVYYGPNGNKTPRLDYFVVKTGNKSIVERCITHLNDINLYNVKLRISVASLPPAPRMVIQQQMLNNVRLNGIRQAPENLIQAMLEKGYLIVNGTDDHGRPIYQNGKAVDFLPSGLGEDVTVYSNLINEAINRCRQVIGLPEGLDGTSGNPYQGLGKQQMAAAASSNALFPSIGRLSPLFSPMYDDVVKKWQEVAKNKKIKVKHKPLGEKTYKVLELSKEFSNADFNSQMVFAPNDQQKEYLVGVISEMSQGYSASQGAVGASKAEFIMVYKLIQAGRLDMAMYRIAQIEKRRELANIQQKQRDIEANGEQQRTSAEYAEQQKRMTAEITESEKRKTVLATEAQKRKTALSDAYIKSFERENAPIPSDVYETMMAEADEEIASVFTDENQGQQQPMQQEMVS